MSPDPALMPEALFTVEPRGIGRPRCFFGSQATTLIAPEQPYVLYQSVCGRGFHMGRTCLEQEQAKEGPEAWSCSYPRSRLAGWTWSLGCTLCVRFIPSSGGKVHFLWMEISADTDPQTHRPGLD